MRILSLDVEGPERCVDEIVSAFGLHLPVLVPTETLYGLACPYDDKECIERVFRIKGRPAGMTLPIALASPEHIGSVAMVRADHARLIEGSLPGPLTVVLEARPDIPAGLARNGTVAVRVPDNRLFPPLCGRVGPLVLTSANLHGGPPVRGPEEAKVQFQDAVPLMVDDGPRDDGTPSTIIDLTTQIPMVLREGAVRSQGILHLSNEKGHGCCH
jgi:L-threonylcarbamoyladenylate synthase